MAALLPSSLSAQPGLRFDPDGVVAEGLTPGAEAVWFGVSREPMGYYSRVLAHAAAAEVDAQGEARYVLKEGAPRKSVWAVVDLATGAYWVATPKDFPLRSLALGAEAFQVGPAGQLDRLADEREEIEVLVARPGVGAWRLSVADGGGLDLDGADDGAWQLALEQLEPLGASPGPPEAFAAGDVLVLIDPTSLELYAARLAL